MKFKNNWTKEVERLRTENKELKIALLNLIWASEVVLYGTRNPAELMQAYNEALKLTMPTGYFVLH